MAKRKAEETDFISKCAEGQRIVIRDMEHKSKAFVPLQIDSGNEVEVVELHNIAKHKIIGRSIKIFNSCLTQANVLGLGWTPPAGLKAIEELKNLEGERGNPVYGGGYGVL